MAIEPIICQKELPPFSSEHPQPRANALAIHWIVTTHGSWLHGNVQGSWYQGRGIPPNQELFRIAEESLTNCAERLSDAEIDIAASVFGQVCVEHKYRVLAATVRHTHCHLVFEPMKEDIKIVIARLKRKAAMHLFADRRQRGLITPPSLWTDRRFRRFIFDEEDLRNSIEYVCQHNIEAGLPRNPFSWIKPPE